MTPTEITGWALLLLGLSAYRLTRLLVIDTFPPVAWVREKWLRRWPMVGDTLRNPPQRLLNHKKIKLVHLGNNVFEVKVGTTLGYLASCTWCLGFWVALAHALFYWAWPSQTLQVASVFSIATIASYLVNQER